MDTRAAGAPDAPHAAAYLALEKGGAEAIGDEALGAALRGDPHPDHRAIGERRLALAQKAYGKLDCTMARDEAREAILALLKAADPADVAGPLGQALSIELLCADGAGDRSAAQAAANRLRALGATDSQPPGGVPAATWSRYPEVDGTVNVLPSAVKIETDPPGARVWIDLAPAGASPVERGLTPGRHLVSAVAPGRVRTVTEIVVKEREPLATHVALAAEPVDRWATIRQAVASARDAKKALDAAGVRRIMRDAGISIAIVLEPGGGARVWARHETGEQDEVSRLAGVESGPLEAAVKDAVRHLAAGALPVDGRDGGDGDGDGDRDEPKATRRPWWVYGLLVGGVLVGAGFVYLLDSGEDTQRIEVHFP